jgi:hypothetical protein
MTTEQAITATAQLLLDFNRAGAAEPTQTKQAFEDRPRRCSKNCGNCVCRRARVRL